MKKRTLILISIILLCVGIFAFNYIKGYEEQKKADEIYAYRKYLDDGEKDYTKNNDFKISNIDIVEGYVEFDIENLSEKDAYISDMFDIKIKNTANSAGVYVEKQGKNLIKSKEKIHLKAKTSINKDAEEWGINGSSIKPDQLEVSTKIYKEYASKEVIGLAIS